MTSPAWTTLQQCQYAHVWFTITQCKAMNMYEKGYVNVCYEKRSLHPSFNLFSVKTDIHKLIRFSYLTFIQSNESFTNSHHRYDSSFTCNAQAKQYLQPWPCTPVSPWTSLLWAYRLSPQHNVGRVVARRPESQAPARMGCVVDSVAHPSRDGSDGGRSLTAVFLHGYGSQQLQEEHKYIYDEM